jgi:hypothetical protein
VIESVVPKDVAKKYGRFDIKVKINEATALRAFV